MVAAAIVGGGVASSLIGADAAGDAADAQAGAAQDAARIQREMFEMVRKDLAPYRDFGQSVLGPMGNMLTGNPAQVMAQLESLPGYQFALQQGLRATQNAFGPRGLGLSGAALRGAGDYATGLAHTTFGDQYNRLMGAAQLGQNSAAQTGAMGTQAGQGIGAALMAGGQAGAAGILGQANAINNAIGQGSNMFLTNSLMQNMGYPGLFGGGGPGPNSIMGTATNWG